MARPTKKEQWKQAIAEKVTKLTPEVVTKLKEAFAIDCNVTEACYYAQISRETYYRWIKKNPELLDEFRYMKQTLPLKAKHNIAQRIHAGSVEDSWKYLERRQSKKNAEKLKMEHEQPKIAEVDPGDYPEDKELSRRFREELLQNIVRRAREKEEQQMQVQNSRQIT